MHVCKKHLSYRPNLWFVDFIYLSSMNFHIIINTLQTPGVSRWHFKNGIKLSKMTTFGNLVTIFGITMSAVKYVQTCLLLVHLFCEIHVKITEMWESKMEFRLVNPMPVFTVLKVFLREFGQCEKVYSSSCWINLSKL